MLYIQLLKLSYIKWLAHQNRIVLINNNHYASMYCLCTYMYKCLEVICQLLIELISKFKGYQYFLKIEGVLKQLSDNISPYMHYIQT